MPQASLKCSCTKEKLSRNHLDEEQQLRSARREARRWRLGQDVGGGISTREADRTGKARPIGFLSEIHQEVLVHRQASFLSVHINLQHDRAFPAGGRESRHYRQARGALPALHEVEAFSLTSCLLHREDSRGPLPAVSNTSTHGSVLNSHWRRVNRQA